MGVHSVSKAGIPAGRLPPEHVLAPGSQRANLSYQSSLADSLSPPAPGLLPASFLSPRSSTTSSPPSLRRSPGHGQSPRCQMLPSFAKSVLLSPDSQPRLNTFHSRALCLSPFALHLFLYPWLQ